MRCELSDYEWTAILKLHACCLGSRVSKKRAKIY
jgi:hypothetical protein